MRWLPILVFVILLLPPGGSMTVTAEEPAGLRPLMREFMGVNGHTVQFKPDLYAKVCGKVRLTFLPNPSSLTWCAPPCAGPASELDFSGKTSC